MAKLYVWNFKIGHEDEDYGWRGCADSVGGRSVCWSFKNNTEKNN